MNRVWVNPQKRRYYRAHLQVDLLGDWTLTRSWGSLDSNHGQVRKELIPNLTRGKETMVRIEKLRKNRGYKPAQTPILTD